MTNERVPENGYYKVMPTALDCVEIERLNFGNKGASSEAEALVFFLQNREQGWMSFTDSDFHVSFCHEEHCGHQVERYFTALVTEKLLEFTNGQYYVTMKFVDICEAAALE